MQVIETDSVQFSSVAQSCPTPCDPVHRSMPGLPVHHQLPEFTQSHVRWVGDIIQLSHLLSSPSSPAPNPSQHQGLFQWVNSLRNRLPYFKSGLCQLPALLLLASYRTSESRSCCCFFFLLWNEDKNRTCLARLSCGLNDGISKKCFIMCLTHIRDSIHIRDGKSVNILNQQTKMDWNGWI